MVFQEQLLTFIADIDISHQELADASGLGNSTISRYCSGERAPKQNSKQVRQLAHGLAMLAVDKGISLSEEEILSALNATVDDGLTVSYNVFLANLKSLLRALGVKRNELARALNYDASHVSKLLSGARTPGNLKTFTNDVASYLARRFIGSKELALIAKLTGTDTERLDTTAALRDNLIVWLGSNARPMQDDSIPHFLAQMDAFDLNDYMKAMHFDEIRLPPAMPRLPTRKEYTGIQKMMESELDFMKTTVLSKTSDSCILYSDMPLEEMAANPEFPKRFLLGMALMLKKGLQLYIIHDINRPFSEMMLGLESYIPMYMTGQISPWYLQKSQSDVFSHLLKVSGVAALEGIAISGKQGEGKYVLYRSKEDVKHYRNRAEALLAKASPLMEIYRRENTEAYAAVLRDIKEKTDCKVICSNLPVYFLPEGKLAVLLEKQPSAVAETIRRYDAKMREEVFDYLKRGRLHLVIPDLSEEQYAVSPLSLALADLFMEEKLELSYSTYLAYREVLERVSSENSNLVVEYSASPAFHNINITIAGDSVVIVSKEKSPAIHFVIHHKKMIRAFQNFIPPIVEE